jgi:hypothetical protein
MCRGFLIPGSQLELLDGVQSCLFGEALGEIEQQWLAQQINEHLEANLGAGRNKFSEVDDETTGVTVSVAQRRMGRQTGRNSSQMGGQTDRQTDRQTSKWDQLGGMCASE